MNPAQTKDIFSQWTYHESGRWVASHGAYAHSIRMPHWVGPPRIPVKDWAEARIHQRDAWLSHWKKQCGIKHASWVTNASHTIP